MTHPLRSTGITPLQHYKETDSPPQLDSDDAAMTYERFIRCGSAKPVANYYEAVRPSPAHRYFRPRGWSRLRLVWGFRSQAEIYHLHLFLSFVPSLCSTGAIIPSSRPALRSRRRAQKLSRLAVAPTLRHAPPLPGHTLTASSTTARLVRSGWRSEGSSLSGADQSRHNLVSGGPEDPNHDAAMRIGSEAPKRRTHSFPRHNSHGTNRDPPPRTVIGDRHKRTDWAETVGCLQQPPFIAPGAERRRPAPRPLAQAATRRSEACAPRPRS
jgi:hypothetical protein